MFHFNLQLNDSIMIIKPTYTTESIDDQNIDNFDMMVIENLVSRYGSDIVFQSINESHSYYGSGGGFSKTGGANVGGLRGMAQSIPSFSIAALICWPAILLVGLGALSNRMREKYEDKKSWINRLHPSFWGEYLATSHKNDISSSSRSDKKKDSWVKRVYRTLFGSAAGSGAVEGTSMLAKDSSIAGFTKNTEEAKHIVMNAIFVPYWITLSNGEILRLRADSEENAKTMANMIIAYTKKPCYNKLNEKISKGCPKYKFYFDDGEICYWSAQTQKQAYKEALDTRKELCTAMNNAMSSSAVLDDLEKPKIDGKVEVKRGEMIEVPQQGKFLNVTTTQPKRKYDPSLKSLPNPVYKYGSLSPYKVGYANFILNIPGYIPEDPIDIVRYFNSTEAQYLIRDIYDKMDKHYDLYRVKMKDGDIYAIPGKYENSVSRIAVELYNAKVKSIKNKLQDSALEEYENFLDDFGNRINSVQSVELIDQAKGKNYTIKKGDEATLVEVTDKYDKNKKYKNFKL